MWGIGLVTGHPSKGFEPPPFVSASKGASQIADCFIRSLGFVAKSGINHAAILLSECKPIVY
jgi:hypothetical protein